MGVRRPKRAQEPGGDAMTLPPRQIIHPLANAQWGDADEDGNRALLVHTLGPNTLQLFPIAADQVKELGDAALAPHVETATIADMAEATSPGGVVLGSV